MNRSLSPWRSFLLLALLAIAPGCGGKVATIEGTVTIDEKPVETGTITFVPIEGTPGSGARAQIAKGVYTIDSSMGTAPGTYRVEIAARRKTGKKIPIGSPAPPGTTADEEVEALPARYNKESTLRETLKAGANTVDFSLATKAKP
jgi:hypothetical protein